MYTTSASSSLRSIYAAREAIRGLALRTPLVPAQSLSTGAHQVRLKLESAQPVGAFKIRGVVCASTGNHGRALAYAAQCLGMRATVCLSRLVPENKLALIRQLGAQLRICGQSQDEAQAECSRLVAEEELIEIPPFDHPDVIAGQGTIGLEILEDFAEVDTVIVPVSGGGLIAGIALALKAASPAIRIIGVSMERGAAMHASLSAGRPVEVKEEESLADSLGGGIGVANRFTFELVRKLVDEIRLIPETAIASAMRRLFLEEGWVAEGAGAIGLALLEEAHQSLLGQRVAIVISGRNVDMALFQRVIAGESLR